MPTVPVYAFEAWSQDVGNNIRARRLATAEKIERLRGARLEGTELIVDEADLDGDQRYPPIVPARDYQMLRAFQDAVDQNINNPLSRAGIERFIMQRLLEPRGIAIRLTRKGEDTLRMCAP
jgi:hypothetical protein